MSTGMCKCQWPVIAFTTLIASVYCSHTLSGSCNAAHMCFNLIHKQQYADAKTAQAAICAVTLATTAPVIHQLPKLRKQLSKERTDHDFHLPMLASTYQMANNKNKKQKSLALHLPRLASTFHIASKQKKEGKVMPCTCQVLLQVIRWQNGRTKKTKSCFAPAKACFKFSDIKQLEQKRTSHALHLPRLASTNGQQTAYGQQKSQQRKRHALHLSGLVSAYQLPLGRQPPSCLEWFPAAHQCPAAG